MTLATPARLALLFCCCTLNPFSISCCDDVRSMRGSIKDPPVGGSHPFSADGWTASRCAGAQR